MMNGIGRDTPHSNPRVHLSRIVILGKDRGKAVIYNRDDKTFYLAGYGEGKRPNRAIMVALIIIASALLRTLDNIITVKETPSPISVLWLLVVLLLASLGGLCYFASCFSHNPLIPYRPSDQWFTEMLNNRKASLLTFALACMLVAAMELACAMLYLQTGRFAPLLCAMLLQPCTTFLMLYRPFAAWRFKKRLADTLARR